MPEQTLGEKSEARIIVEAIEVLAAQVKRIADLLERQEREAHEPRLGQ